MKTSGCVSGSMLANNAAVAEWCRQPLANAWQRTTNSVSCMIELVVVMHAYKNPKQEVSRPQKHHSYLLMHRARTYGRLSRLDTTTMVAAISDEARKKFRRSWTK